MRLLFGVYYFVTAQGARLTEPFATDLAYERPDTCVNWHVSCEVVMSVETLAALIAFEHFADIVVIGVITIIATIVIAIGAAARRAADCSIHRVSSRLSFTSFHLHCAEHLRRVALDVVASAGDGGRGQ